MLIDNNLIAYEYYKGRYVPNEIYYSGEKEETKNINKYSNTKDLPILILEDDIVNSEGYGLKKGFYNIIPDEYKDFLLIYQTGKLKAKVPVVEVKSTPTANPSQQKLKKMSVKKYQKYKEKEYRKYMKGINPSEFEYTEVTIEYIKENNTYLISYRTNTYQLSGIIKF